MFLSRHLPFEKLKKNEEEILHRRPSEKPLLPDRRAVVSEKDPSLLLSPKLSARFCDQAAVNEAAVSTDLESIITDATSVKSGRRSSIVNFAYQKLSSSNKSEDPALLTRWRRSKRSRRIDKYLEAEGRRRHMRVLLLGVGSLAYSSWTDVVATQELSGSEGEPSWSIHQLSKMHGERKKWLHMLEIINSIIFTVDIRDYAHWLDEDQAFTWMHENICCWGSTANSRTFQSAKLALCFIKTVEFDEMLTREPISRYFEDYSENTSCHEDAMDFFVKRFMTLNTTHDAIDVKVFFIADLPKQEDWIAIQHFFLHGNVSS